MSTGWITRASTSSIPAQDYLVTIVLGGALAIYYFATDLRLVLVGAAIFIALAYLRLDLALLWVVFTLPFYLPTYSNPLPPKVFDAWSFSLVEFAILACFTAWGGRVGASLVARRRGRPPIVRLPPLARALLPVVLFVVAATVTLPAAKYLKVGLREYRVVIVEPILFYVMLVTTVRSRQELWRMVHGLVALGLVVSLYALYHYVFVGVVEATGGVRRVLAIYHSPNALGLLLGRLAALALALAVWREGRWRLAYLGAVGIIVVALFLTYSRGAWLGVGAAILLLAGLRGRRELMAAAAGLGLACLGVVAWGLQRLLAGDTVLRRLAVWRSALAMIRDHPVFGVGPDNFLYYYRSEGYLLPEGALEPDISHPHNLILDGWLRLGLLGLAALLWLQLVFWQRGWRLFRRLKGDPLQAVVVGLAAAMAASLAHGLIDNSFFLVDLAILFWATFGLLQSLDWQTQSTGPGDAACAFW